MACQKFAFECGEESLAHGIVVGITDRSMDGRTPACRQRPPNASAVYWVGCPVAVVDDVDRLALAIAISSAASTSSVRRCVSIASRRSGD